jgi:hypothetical protein
MDEIEQQKRLNTLLEARVPPLAWNCTVPIVIAHEGNVHHHGTGTLLRIADHHFLVTAGHVFKQAAQHGKSLGIGGASDGRFIGLSGNTLVSAEGQYGSADDPLDIGLHVLSPSAVGRLSSRQFVTLGDVDFEPQTNAAVYTLFGYPAIWSKPSCSDSDPLQFRPLQYTTLGYDRDVDALENYQEVLHLLLDARLQGITGDDGRPVSFCDLSGQAAEFPRKLGGISGCSVWRIGGFSRSSDLRDPERARLVAVQTSVYHSKKAIKATRWIAVSTLIHGAFPELRPALGLWRL